MYANWAPKDTKAHAVAGYCISLEPSFSRREAHVDSAPSTARFRWQPPIRERAPRTLKPTVLIFSAAASAPPRSRRISLHFSLSVALSSGSSFCYILLQGLFDLFFMKVACVSRYENFLILFSLAIWMLEIGLYIMSQQQAPFDGVLTAAWSPDWRQEKIVWRSIFF